VIIGAGIAGLCCARDLAYAGIDVTVLEASDDVGGRVRTDIVDGYQLDRGFQVYLTAYPEGRRYLDLAALDLRPFEPGAMIRMRSRSEFTSLHDVMRQPSTVLATAMSPAATPLEKWRMLSLKREVRRGQPEDLLNLPQATALQRLKQFGFSDQAIARFFRPLFGGVFLDDSLGVSSRALDYDFRMFAEGNAAVPAKGMGEIPRQIASNLRPCMIGLNERVVSITNRLVVTEKGESILADAIVIATDGDTAARLAPELVRPISRWAGTTCLYFAAEAGKYGRRLFGRPVVLLVEGGAGPINSIVSMSDVCDRYAPTDGNLIGVNLIGARDELPEVLERRVRAQLVDIFGNDVDHWRLLRRYDITKSLPDQSTAALATPHKPVRLRPGLYVAGDHVDQSSINGAMCAGRRAAEAIIADRSA
jgi:protoporphyrinogen oxidase